ncbi:hypothetical protein AMAG_14261 [Allomyces macrogynus ATCC 38327]|uniref:Required for respiratory growth protein 9, mitochondrial n=1 Tax=Allomyces macrogynus (strain ATCC 38327) TaxID=578462 RepID=A0A0L0T4P4_ALLM3|nr:hypothetical protein AMAG_14261 [Allomyces macrogynus ATCC 38327]|eukprot:KNE69715.1 hypothetical protein AMAG_14261 [Allomyces macrogynus ATCC 38327]
MYRVASRATAVAHAVPWPRPRLHLPAAAIWAVTARVCRPAATVSTGFATARSNSSDSSSHDDKNGATGVAAPSNSTSTAADAAKPPRRLVAHSSPLDLLKKKSVAKSELSKKPARNPASVLASLGIDLDPAELAPPQPGAPPRPGSTPFGAPRPPRSAPSVRSRDGDHHGDRPPKNPDLSRRPPSTSSSRWRPPPSPPTPATDRWDPRKKLPRSAMDRIRFLHAQDPVQFSPAKLARAYGIGYEAVKRILRSKYVPDAERAEEMDKSRAAVKVAWRHAQATARKVKLKKEREEAEARVAEGGVERGAARGRVNVAPADAVEVDMEGGDGGDATEGAEATNVVDDDAALVEPATRPPRPAPTPAPTTTPSSSEGKDSPDDWSWLAR